MNISIKELGSAVAVYRCGSFAEAAYQTSFSVSAISKHVQHVENELGVKLFKRKNYKNNKLLTEEGERLLPYILQLTETAERMERVADELRSESAHLSVGSIEIMWGSAIDRILTEFSLKFPEITVENRYIHLREIIHGIDTMALDCSFLLLNRDSPDSMVEAVRQIGKEDLRICMGFSQSSMHIAIRNDHPLAGADSVSLRELADETFLFDLDAAQFPESVLNITHLIGRSFDRIKKKYIDSKRLNMVLGIVAAGGGVFAKPDMQRMEFPGVAILPVRDCPTDVAFLFLFHRRNDRDNFLKFRRFVESSFELKEM